MAKRLSVPKLLWWSLRHDLKPRSCWYRIKRDAKKSARTLYRSVVTLIVSAMSIVEALCKFVCLPFDPVITLYKTTRAVLINPDQADRVRRMICEPAKNSKD